MISFADAAVDWIRQREVRLSASTERAYRGEVDRLAQFFAKKYGGLALGEFTEAHWNDYLSELCGVRRHVVTCRKKPLAQGSAEQAIRISAAFLRWARDDGLLPWAPRMAQALPAPRSARSSHRRTLVDFSVEAEFVHPALGNLLSHPPVADAGLSELRAQMAVSLAYWAGLKSGEIASLKNGDIVTDGIHFQLRHPRLKSVSTISGNLSATWVQYRCMREEVGAALNQRSPVIAALGSDQSISAWSVWALITQHVEKVTGIRQHHSAQSLRRSRIKAMTAEYAPQIGELARYTQRSTIDFVPPTKPRRTARRPIGGFG
jgi:site-specific recombinase XerD